LRKVPEELADLMGNSAGDGRRRFGPKATRHWHNVS
jgi:hypothetical protein